MRGACAVRTGSAQRSLTSTVRGRIDALRTQYWSLPTIPPGGMVICALSPRPLQSVSFAGVGHSMSARVVNTLGGADADADVGSNGGARVLKLSSATIE